MFICRNRFDCRDALNHKWLKCVEKENKKATRLNTRNLRKYIVRRKWQV